jgi:hypothetical protein
LSTFTATQLCFDNDPYPNSNVVTPKIGIFKSSEGKEWAIEMTFDAGRKSQTKDLRPDLPLVIHY